MLAFTSLESSREKLYQLNHAETIKAIFLITCEFLNIDNRHFDDFDYYQANKQFTANNKLLHIVAMKLNSTLEVKLRRSPKIKQKLLTVYKSINKKKNTTEKSLSPELIQELREYYCNEYKFMKDELDYKYDEVKWKNFE